MIVVTETLAWSGAVALSANVRTGSVDETDEQAGAAHLIEHLLFRGSEHYGPGAVDRLFDELGADISASTDRTATQLATWVMAADVQRAVHAMADVLWRPALRDEDVASEREIVLEELMMIEDAPEELTFELLGDAVFPASPLGRPVIGRRETIESLTSESLAAFHRQHYSTTPVYWVAVGAVDHDELCAQVLAGLPSWRAASVVKSAPQIDLPPRRIVVQRPSEQTHLALAVPITGPLLKQRAVLRVLDALLGGPPSSRLFQEIRERRGLAYSVSSFVELYDGFGVFGAYVGTRPERFGVAADVLATELSKAARGELAADDIAWARQHIAGRAGLQAETPAGRAGLLAGRVINGLPIVTPGQVAAEVAAIEPEQLAEAAATLLGALPTAAAACVAPDATAAAAALDAAGLATG